MRVPPSAPASAASAASAAAASRDRVLAAAAQAFAQRFGVVPQGDAQAILAHVDADAPDLSTAVNEALFHHGPAAFTAAVRQKLVAPVATPAPKPAG